MQEDLRGHLVRVFNNLLGFWPNSNKLSSFGQFCNELLVQCTCNHVFCTFIYNIMVTYLNVKRPKGFPIGLRETLLFLKALYSLFLIRAWARCYCHTAGISGSPRSRLFWGAMKKYLFVKALYY